MATNGENGYVSHEYLDKDIGSAPALNKIRTAGAVSLSPELFEKLYLQPRESAGKSGIRHYLGNPTPIGLVGFLLCLTPLSNILMGWHSASPSLGLAASAFWLTYAVTLQDGVYGIIKGYPNQAAFMNEFAYILLYMGVLCTFYMIAALRTNAAFVALFLWLLLTFFCLAGAFFQTYSGAAALAGKLQVAGGAFSFLACLVGWWILLSLLLASVDFPFQLPLGDLTSIVPGYKSRHKEVADMV
ncbi:hypothetical protein PG988_012163 [Apiospora saccharicola]